HWTKAGGVAAGLVGTVSKSGMAILGWVINIALIPVLTFYILRDWDILKDRIRELLPLNSQEKVVTIVRDSDSVLSAFLRGQLMVMFALGTIYSIGLWMIGLDFSLLIGMLAGIVSFVPYLGFIVGILIAGIVAMVQFHDVYQLLPVLMVFGVGQLVESFLLTPLLVGDKIGLHPVAVIFAVMAGGQLFGFFGILLALPVAAVVMVLLRHAHERYLRSQLYTG
ncbi:MAG: AI-2E family transporter, partial [Gammaproteobacteria bacterium]|nr:AI-2E family transporter [Gammaproteobacteria bacterium]